MVVGDLVLVIVARDEGILTLTLSNSIISADVSYEVARQAALSNTFEIIKNVKVIDFQNGTGAVHVTSNDDPEIMSLFTLTKILDEAFWNELKAKYDADIAVVLPDRYTILFAPVIEAEIIESLKELAEDWIVDSNHVQSTKPIVWTENGWTTTY